jgi:hypothetical protein
MNKTSNMPRFSAAVVAVVVILAFGSMAHADQFTGDGDGTSWESPLNWAAGVVPLNNNSAILIGADDEVVFDADTFAALLLAQNTNSGTEYRMARLLMGDSLAGATNGTHSLTMDQGDGITVRATNVTSTVIGGRPNKFSTLNIVSGTTNLEGTAVRVGHGDGGSGTVNVTGGDLILGRGGLQLGNPNGLGDGSLNISGGYLATRNSVSIFAAGVFNIIGSSATAIEIGTEGSTDGSWSQETGGILRVGFDSGGATAILIDEVDQNPGVSGDGIATFEAGSILELSNLGGFNNFNVWVPVMAADGGIVGEPTLSQASVDAGWDSRVNGNVLEVQLAGTSNTLKGDADLSTVVDFSDIPAFITILQSGVYQAEADCDCSGTIDFSDIPAFILILQAG